MKVCEKVKAKGTTSYNEVADELVNEFTDSRCSSPADGANVSILYVIFLFIFTHCVLIRLMII